ncbi:MAG: cache domain-containing protein [Spirochaetes bacterium]|nr:cache domain-containing protein [Spirochaetota bacterium]
MKLANKIFISFFGIIVFGGISSAVVGTVLVSRSLRSEAFSRVENDLKSAQLFIEDRLSELSIASQILSGGLEWNTDLPGNPDLAFIITGDRARFRIHLEETAGIMLPDDRRGVVTIPTDLLDAVSFNLSRVDLRTLCDGKNTLWLFAVTPGEKGDAFCGVLLNGNDRFISELHEHLFERLLYGAKPFGTVTIFCGPTRIATTVLGPTGEVAVGTRVSDEVEKRVLAEGEIWLDRAYVVDDWYLSAYRPIRSPAGKNIGILYVGVLEKKYLDIKRRAVILLSGITVPMIGLLIFGVFLLSRSITKPVSALAFASRKIASGERDTKAVQAGGASELKTLAKSFNFMARAIVKREKLLVQKNEQLEEANRDYQELLSFVTHELNNSIGSLLLNISILKDGTVGEFNEEQNEVITLLLRDVARFREMVRNYLNISRLEKGTLKYRPEELDLRRTVVEPVLTRLAGRIEHKKMNILWDWEEEARLTADADLLDICYSNLVINAVKYGADWIRLSGKKEGGNWLLGVHNGGAPIPAEEIPLLFQKFSRLVKSDDGAGLGLYLVRKIVERHGGEVFCTSSEAEGTCFYMKLPAGI